MSAGAVWDAVDARKRGAECSRGLLWPDASTRLPRPKRVGLAAYNHAFDQKSKRTLSTHSHKCKHRPSTDLISATRPCRCEDGKTCMWKVSLWYAHFQRKDRSFIIAEIGTATHSSSHIVPGFAVRPTTNMIHNCSLPSTRDGEV